MAESKEELVLKLKCKDGKLYGNQRYLREKSKLIRSLEKSTDEKCKVLEIPFRKIEVKAFLDLCDQVGTDKDFEQYLKKISYIDFVRMVEWFDLGDYGHNLYDGMFFSGANYPKFWDECKACYHTYFVSNNKMKLRCDDGNISRDKRYLGEINIETNSKCKMLKIPFTKKEVMEFLDRCEDIIKRNNIKNYAEFCKMADCSDDSGLCNGSEIIIDGLYYSGVNCSDFWDKNAKRYTEIESDDEYSSSDADESDNSSEGVKQSIYDYLPQIFVKLGYQ